MIDEKKIIEGVKLILEGLGVDLNNENFKKTPQRYLNFLKELIEPKITDDDYTYFKSIGNLVISKNIVVYSLCPHHLLPVIYNVNIAYIPVEEVVGISKLSRLALELGSKLLLQEDYTEQLADRLIKFVKSNDVMVVVEGKHFCMMMRGVKQQNSSIITSAIRGRFNKLDVRLETLRLMSGLTW
jgi:GTP cyclohydrolase I